MIIIPNCLTEKLNIPDIYKCEHNEFLCFYILIEVHI